MKDLFCWIKPWFLSIWKTFKIEDANILFITATVTAIGKLCTGLISIIALVVVIYQLKIQVTRLKRERLKLKETECHDKGFEK